MGKVKVQDHSTVIPFDLHKLEEPKDIATILKIENSRRERTGYWRKRVCIVIYESFVWIICTNAGAISIAMFLVSFTFIINWVFETYDKVFTLGDPTYTKALNMAYREAYVFKFADRAGVRFACSIKLCLKEDDGCKGITVKEIFRPVIIRALI